MLNQKPLEKFKTKSGKEVEIYLPTTERVTALLVFVNRLTEEDTFLNFTGRPKTILEETHWIKTALDSIEKKRGFYIWATCQGKIIASAGVARGGPRDDHVGTLSLMVDRDFRSDGIGKHLLGFILNQAKAMAIKIVILDLFGTNTIAIELYRKLGFQEYARLPKGFYRKGKYADAIKMYKEL